MKKNSYTKAVLIRELAFSVGITQKKARFVLEALQIIALREAAVQGFTIPGICRIDVVHRKERRVRNPQTGEKILIAEHNTLRVRALKKARALVTPPPENMITVLPPDPPVLDDFSTAVSFRCAQCGQEIEAPGSAVGLQAECPACGAQVMIPSVSEPGTLHGSPIAQATPEPAAPPAPLPHTAPAAAQAASQRPAAGFSLISRTSPAASSPPIESSLPKNKNQTIRIDLSAFSMDRNSGSASQPSPRKRMISFFCKDCRQEIEAPADMAGSASECPGCGVSFEVPFFSDPGTLHGSDLEQRTPEELKAIKGRTIRIEVPDDV